MNTPPNPDETKAPPTRSWVWHCTKESIAAGQISVLAALETLCAVGLYWWLSYRFDWHWFSMVGLIAAPMLLLRSEESVELGLEMLRRWDEREASDVGSWAWGVMIVIAGLVYVGIGYFLPKICLPGYEGWPLFWRESVIGSVAFVVADTVEFAYARAIPKSIALSALMVVGAIAVILEVFGAIPYAGRGQLLGAMVIAVAGEDKGLRALIFGPSYILGIMLLALFVRWFASLRYILHGLKHLPRNWRENLWVIDLVHPPELLPQAGRVDGNFFTVTGLWRGLADEKGSAKAATAFLIPTYYLPALAYRWSIKASAWLWWPLALALTPPFEDLDGYKLRRRAAVVSRGAWSKLLLFALPVLLAWLALSLNLGFKEWLQSLSPTIADFAGRLLTAVPPPPLGLRFGLLCLALLLAGLLLWRSNDLAASYPEVLDGPKGYDDLNNEQKADFEASARPMERLRLLFIVTLFLLGEAVALAFVHAKNPPEIERLVWPWLLEWL